MNSVIIEDVALSISKLRMYPYFDIAHYILMSIAVKEDTPQSGSSKFSRRHPFACWLATMLMCFGGVILSNFISGSPLLTCFDDTTSVLTATIVWYIINYFPFDLFYRICKFLPVRIVVCSLKEIQRAKKIGIGVHHGLVHFPNSVVMCILLGLLKGAGYLEMKILQRLVRGVWLPAATEFLYPTFTTKISLLAAVAYYAHHLDLIPLPEAQLFLAIAAIFVYMRVTMLLLGLKDPLVPFENIVCTILFGGVVDAIRVAFEGGRGVSSSATAGHSTTSGLGGASTFGVSGPPPPAGVGGPASTATSASVTGTSSAGSTGVPGSTSSTTGMSTNANASATGAAGQATGRDSLWRQPPTSPNDKKRD